MYRDSNKSQISYSLYFFPIFFKYFCEVLLEVSNGNSMATNEKLPQPRGLFIDQKDFLVK